MNARSRRPSLVTIAPERADTSGDGAIVDGLKAGRVEALAEAFDRWHGRVRVLARRLLSDPASAEDVVQDVFASLIRAARGFRGDVDIETFVLAIAVKRARHHRRAAFRRRRALERLARQDRLTRPDPEADAYRRELGLRLEAALDRLPIAQREAFVLCEVEEMSSPRASEIAGVPEATIRTRLFHARRRLRDLLARELGE
ncbi:MAG TPA: RNA polymerase sigma factor [Polyangia bacterium]|nr:RNA polymerase sigma factor [Polyangia bacterium]